MQFVFDERKAAQAAVHLLRRYGKPMRYISLIKLLYLADRKALIETGYPITGDRLVSMRRGPVLSRVFDLIKAETEDDHSVWHDYVTPPTNYKVEATGSEEIDEADDELSDYDKVVLDTIFDEFGGRTWGDLIDYTHTLPEWVDPKGSSRDIDPRDILESAGLDEEEISWAEHDAATTHALHTRYVVSR